MVTEKLATENVLVWTGPEQEAKHINKETRRREEVK